MKKFSVEVSTGVQKDTQGLESLSVIKVVPWKEIKALLHFLYQSKYASEVPLWGRKVAALKINNVGRELLV